MAVTAMAFIIRRLRKKERGSYVKRYHRMLLIMKATKGK
jgi:hypothetical protein